MTDIRDLGILAMGTRLRVLAEVMSATVKDFYATYDLPFEPRCFPVFQLVQRQPDISIAAVAAQIGVSHTAVNALCKPLLEAGLVTAHANRDDARAKSLRLTEAGQVLFTRMQPAWFALETALNATFDRDAVLKTLDVLDEAVADAALPRALKRTLSREAVTAGLRLVPFDPADDVHRRAFAAFNIEWLETYFTVEPVDHAMFADPEGSILNPGGEIVMAAVGGQMVGTGAIIKRSDTIYELAKMAVSRPYQGKGIGEAIVHHFEDRARALGLEKLYLVSSTKLPHAVPLYRKLGWVNSDAGLHIHYQRSDISLEKVL